MIWTWIKQVWFHLIDINWHICISLNFVISRAKSSEKFVSSPEEVFLGKGILKIFSKCKENAHVKLWFKKKKWVKICEKVWSAFPKTSMEGCFWKLNKIVPKLCYHLENVTLHSVNLILSILKRLMFWKHLTNSDHATTWSNVYVT